MTELVSFTQFSIQNFKRFSGRHDIKFNSGEGRLTIIGAQNGLGKTTLMEAIHLTLYGKKGFEKLYPESEYHTWMANAYSVDADNSEKLNFSLEMEGAALGKVRISRIYWMSEGIDDSDREEFVISVDGKPIQREGRQSLLDYSNNWIEDFIPQAAMRKFLVDGERLSELDPKKIDSEIVTGIDDVTGIGLLHRLHRHLNNVRKSTLSSMAPDEMELGIDHLSSMQESLKEEQKESERKLSEAENSLSFTNNKIVTLQDEIENLTRDGGARNVELRMNYAIRQSELTASRKEVHHHLMESIPFIVAGFPSDLEEWDFTETLAQLQSKQHRTDQLEFLNDVIQTSGVGKKTQTKLMQAGENILDLSDQDLADSRLSKLNVESLNQLKNRFVELGLTDAKSRVADSINESLDRLNAFNTAEDDLRKVSVGLGISEKAAELRELAKSLGVTQAEIASLKGAIRQLKESRNDVEKRILEIRQREDSDSLFNRRLSRIDKLEKLTELVLNDVRQKFSKPLENSFAEGFELLSRKSERIEEVRINPLDYSLFLKMKGFDGNWLDRDLSATEKQHVGLALVYALRRASTEWSMPLPVIIDTPTSRMDLEHKSWSVTKFYPMLSNQVIVLATSDDLAGGLYQELSDSGILANELVIEEISDNSVKISESNLEEFFRL